jgi:hypothetical protein
MKEPLSTKRVHDSLSRYLRNRPDIGVRKVIVDGVLEAKNPFEPIAFRAPKRCFVLLALLAILLLACFLYFGYLR